MKRRLTFLLVITALIWGTVNYTPAPVQAEAVPVFSDIKGHWAEKTITEMVEKGILDGFSDGTFKPNDPVKVDQFIKMLILSYTDLHRNGSRTWNNLFLQSLSAENQAIIKQDYRYFNFQPNPVGYWAKDFIDIASDLHFLNKNRYSDFQADMNREHVAEIIYYTLQETEFLEDGSFGQKMAQQYGDLMGASEREQRFIAESLVKGIMEGFPNGFFGVGTKVTRAQALVILNRLTDKAKRLAIEVSPENFEKVVPTANNGNKIVVFPDQRMWDAYEALTAVGQLRGANHDLYETTLRFYKDQLEKDAVTKPLAGSPPEYEEAAIWLDPQYNTYGITIRLRDGSLARNQEAIDQFANHLFGFNAISFRELFNEVCTLVQEGKAVIARNKIIGNDQISIHIDEKAKTVIFSIATKR